MIQRIQTIYLILATIVGSLLLFFGFAEFYANDHIYLFNFIGINILSEGTNFSPVYSVAVTTFTVLCILLPFVVIFLYKNRKLQLKLLSLSMGVCAGLLATVFIYLLGVKGFIPAANEVETQYKLGVVIPLIEFVFLFLAYSGVKKDENLIKSLNRLR